MICAKCLPLPTSVIIMTLIIYYCDLRSQPLVFIYRADCPISGRAAVLLYELLNYAVRLHIIHGTRLSTFPLNNEFIRIILN